ncbi:hypothetical protein M0638_07575 [Roseomonas sp. NAR14]|uniref:Uncharacterized protein n=1 Tax=Roseomonas acroporae TaxID=2937791 RepID=A0A9X1Y8J5_9PROT|nr:hypothetical protein [Roseomonas acroporae]MCK8784235.1 hypothetical protein [Roseomonas acroporae]
MHAIRRKLRLAVRPAILLLAFALVLFEETVWRWGGALGALLARIPLLAALERLVARLPPPAVFALFLVPMALLLPVKLAALWLIAAGHPLLGLGVIVAAKVGGTAVSARLYAIAEPKLMQVPAFAWARGKVAALLARAHAFLDASPAWQSARRAMAALRERARALRVRLAGAGGGLGLRLAAARRCLRRTA